MNSLIIGCGYVGTAVGQVWKKQGHTLTVSTRKFHRIVELKSFADVVVKLPTSFSTILDQQEILLLCPGADSPSSYEETYLKTAHELIEGFSTNNSIRQLIYTSSTSVYGDQKGAWVDETSALFPLNQQAEILIETEKLLLSLATPKRQVCIFRLGEIIGPHRGIRERLHRLQGRPLAGDGKNHTNLSPLVDIISGINFAVKNQLNGIYNLCHDLHVTRKELYEEIRKEEKLSPIEWDHSLQNIHGGDKKVSSKKLKDLGFSFQSITF